MQSILSDRQILSVSQLNRNVRHLIETQLPLLWVEGEISNFARPASGHWYLTLKDDQAQVRCAMFRNANQRVAFQPANGTQVLVRCRAGLYEGRGEYQLIVEHMEEAGFGALQRKFEQLKQQLSDEGLFDNQHKLPMPQAVNHVGIITSPTGAAVKDVLSVLKRRFPAIKVSIFPTAVQGDQAAGQIVDTIAMANQHNQCDALIIGRGGGSLEDLWPFNEEAVARAIFSSQIPTISAVGHEIDFTIADFVADLRAPTPSAAAELISPDGSEMYAQFKGLEASLINTVHRRLQKYDQNVVNLHKRLRHPGRKLQEQAQHLDHLDIRLKRAVRSRIEQHQHQIILKRDRLLRQHPKSLLMEYGQKVKDAVGQLSKTVSQQLNAKMRHAEQTIHLLDAVSPLKILSRGFSVIRDDKNVVIKSVSSVSLGENLKGRVADGEIHFAVTKTTKNDRSEH
jgi:exodeoxyribonuclease VII large subunit